MLTTLVATAIVLGVLIFVHELGHFLTAKLVDIEVPRFSIGFGPKVVGFRRGETEYVLSLLPLGGYVKMAGMEELEPIEGGGEPKPEAQARGPRPRDFESKSLAARTLVISAGVIMNLLFAVAAFAAIGLIWGVPKIPPAVVGGVTEERLPVGAGGLASIEPGSRITRVGDARITDIQELRVALLSADPGPLDVELADGGTIRIDVPASDSLRTELALAIEPEAELAPVIQAVLAGGAAEAGGMEAGDRVLSVAGRPISGWQELVSAIEEHPGEPVPLRVLRGGDTVALTVTPEIVTVSDGRAYGRIGVQSSGVAASAFRERVGPVGALAFGFTETGRWVAATLGFLGGLFTGEQSARDLGGPIAIGQISGQAARAGFEPFLSFMALLSVNLAVLNLLPIPVLDGGQLVFLLIEGVRGRSLSIQQRIRWSQVGFIIILAIMVFAIGNDVLRWIGL